MRSAQKLSLMLPLALALGGCGLGVSALPEVWDRIADPDATYHMEVQIKHAIYCELKQAVIDARKLPVPRRIFQGRDVTTVEDIYLPDSWGVLVQLSLQAEEKSTLSPGVTFKNPTEGALTGFTVGPPFIAQSFQLGIGGVLSSQNTRYDKYNFFYVVRDLKEPMNPANSSCITRPATILGSTPSTSSPLVNAANLGIRDWLLSAVRVIDYHRSSRKEDSDIGPAINPSGSIASDSSTYSNKFIIVSSANVTPTWNLIRLGTPSTPLLDASRTRTHDLIITLGPGALERSKTLLGKPSVAVVPSSSAVASHLAAQIGSAVSNALQR